jgi:hypothetical protein
MIAGGLGGRVAMRIAALAAPDGVQPDRGGATIGEITLEGTMFLILFAGLSSALIGTAAQRRGLLLALRPPRRSARTARRAAWPTGGRRGGRIAVAGRRRGRRRDRRRAAQGAVVALAVLFGWLTVVAPVVGASGSRWWTPNAPGPSRWPTLTVVGGVAHAA